jgi:hypothetical protein
VNLFPASTSLERPAIRIAALGVMLFGLAVICLAPAKAESATLAQATQVTPVTQATIEAPERRVLLLTDKPGDPFIDRIRAEVAGLGLAVLVRNSAGSLEDEARAEHAVAAIRVLPSLKGVEVWMADETSGRSLLRQLIVDERPGGPDQGLIALQTTELLRTSLFPKQANPLAQPAEPAALPGAQPVAAAHAAATPAPSRMAETGIQAGFGTIYSPGGAGPAMQGWLELHQFWSPRLGLALDFSFPLGGSTVSAVEGSSRVGTYLGGIEFLVRSRPQHSYYANAGIAASVAWIVAHGQEARAPLKDASSSAVVGAAYLRASAGWSGSFYKIGVLGLAGGTMKRIAIRFAGNDAADWGWPFLAAFLTAELDWH